MEDVKDGLSYEELADALDGVWTVYEVHEDGKRRRGLAEVLPPPIL